MANLSIDTDIEVKPDSMPEKMTKHSTRSIDLKLQIIIILYEYEPNFSNMHYL